MVAVYRRSCVVKGTSRGQNCQVSSAPRRFPSHKDKNIVSLLHLILMVEWL